MSVLLLWLTSTSALAGKDPCKKVNVDEGQDPFTGESVVKATLGADQLTLKNDELGFSIAIVTAGVVAENLPAGFEFQWLLEDSSVIKMTSTEEVTPRATPTGYGVYTAFQTPLGITPEIVRQVAASPPVMARYTLKAQEITNDIGKKGQAAVQAMFACVASKM